MLCENCNENEANVRYTQIINGVKKEMNLCEECAHKLGVGEININMPIDFSNFLPCSYLRKNRLEHNIRHWLHLQHWGYSLCKR